MHDGTTAGDLNARTRTDESETESSTDASLPNPDDLNRFAVDVLRVLERDGIQSGRSVTRALEDAYGFAISDGRVYPQLGKLERWDLVDRWDTDGRTKACEITARGERVLDRRRTFLGGASA